MTKNSQHIPAAPETIVEELAAFVVKAKFEDISVPARQQLKAHILDAVGCAFAALEAPPLKALRAQIVRANRKLTGGSKFIPRQQP
jgi:2-methylcitrate dehydratase